MERKRRRREKSVKVRKKLIDKNNEKSFKKIEEKIAEKKIEKNDKTGGEK